MYHKKYPVLPYEERGAVLFRLQIQSLFSCGCNHDSLDGVHAVLRLVKDLGAGCTEDFVGNFLLGNAEALIDVTANAGLEIVEAG